MNLGELNYFLGIEVYYVPNGTILLQYQYILEIFSNMDMTNCKGVATHMCSSLPLRYTTLYRHTLYKLQYLSFMHSDISFVVNKLS